MSVKPTYDSPNQADEKTEEKQNQYECYYVSHNGDKGKTKK